MWEKQKSTFKLINLFKSKEIIFKMLKNNKKRAVQGHNRGVPGAAGGGVWENTEALVVGTEISFSDDKNVLKSDYCNSYTIL